MVKGFSLAELIITLAIIGTLIMLGIPTYARIYSFVQLRGDGRRLTSDLREFHQRAISEHFDYRFTFSGNKTYTIEYYDGAWQPKKTVEVQKEVTIQSATSPITFYPLGNADPLGEAVIVIENIEGENSTIKVKSTTGHVSIQ